MNLTFAIAASLHILPGDYNAFHPSVALEHEGWSIGAFYNSESRVSLVAGRSFVWDNVWAEIGLATGYAAAPVVPFARVGLEHEGIRYFVAPAATVDGDFGFVLGAEIKI